MEDSLDEHFQHDGHIPIHTYTSHEPTPIKHIPVYEQDYITQMTKT
jgi:hypothetical protein